MWITWCLSTGFRRLTTWSPSSVDCLSISQPLFHLEVSFPAVRSCGFNLPFFSLVLVFKGFRIGIFILVDVWEVILATLRWTLPAQISVVSDCSGLIVRSFSLWHGQAIGYLTPGQRAPAFLALAFWQGWSFGTLCFASHAFQGSCPLHAAGCWGAVFVRGHGGWVVVGALGGYCIICRTGLLWS